MNRKTRTFFQIKEIVSHGKLTIEDLRDGFFVCSLEFDDNKNYGSVSSTDYGLECAIQQLYKFMQRVILQ